MIPDWFVHAAWGFGIAIFLPVLLRRPWRDEMGGALRLTAIRCSDCGARWTAWPRTRSYWHRCKAVRDDA